jgi:chitinase
MHRRSSGTWTLCSLLFAFACACSAASDVPIATDAGSLSGDDAGAIGVVDAGGSSSVDSATDAATDIKPPTADAETDAPAQQTARVVAYLPNYSGSYADWARRIDFAKMTHLNLAFATANGNNGWDMGASASDVAALVTAAHAAGTRVLASLGGGGGDQSVIARFTNAANVPALVQNLDTFVAAHHLDGVDIDIEDGNHLGADYARFVAAVVAKLRPQGKLVTAAVAQYLQSGMSDATLHSFDFINVMIYSSYADSVAAMTYYSGTKGVPRALIVLGAGFFGTDASGNEYAYKDILAADPGASANDQAQVRGTAVHYTGMASMKKLATYAKGYGGIMFWELSEDTTDAHSLYKVIQGEF